jgi:hypothetical protein
MKIADAVKLADKTEQVKELKKNGYFLNSAMAFLEPEDKEVAAWDLIYYDIKTNQVAQIVIDKDAVFLKEKGTPIHPTKEALDLKEIKTNSGKMLEKASKEFSKYKQPISQIIMTVQKEGGKTVWKINYITKMLYLIAVTIDAKTGKILSSEQHNLAK